MAGSDRNERPLKTSDDTFERLRSRHRDLRLVSTLVMLVLAGGLAMMWPEWQSEAVARFGEKFPTRFLAAELLVMVLLVTFYVWRKGVKTDRLLRRFAEQRGLSEALRCRLDQARSILEASAGMDLNADTAESLQVLLQSVTESLWGDRGVLYRVRGSAGNLERDGVFPSSAQAPAAEALTFEDEVAGAVVRAEEHLVLGKDNDPKEAGVSSSWPDHYHGVVATPLKLGDEVVGVILIRNPGEEDVAIDEDGLALLDVFAGFTAGVIHNLRSFGQVADRSAQLDNAHRTLALFQRELGEIQTITTLGRISMSLAQGLARPLSRISNQMEQLSKCRPASSEADEARGALRRDVRLIKHRVRGLVDFATRYRMSFSMLDLNKLVETSIALRRESLRSQKVSVQFDPQAGLPTTVADPLRMRQVVLSLLSVSEHFFDQATGSRQVRIRTTGDASGLRLVVEFRGEGGHADAVRSLLTEGADIGARHREHGLDLSVASTIVRQHHGEIAVDVDASGGVELTVELPVRTEAPPPPSEVSPALAAIDSVPASVEEVVDRIFGFEEDTATRPVAAAQEEDMEAEWLPGDDLDVHTGAAGAEPAEAPEAWEDAAADEQPQAPLASIEELCDEAPFPLDEAPFPLDEAPEPEHEETFEEYMQFGDEEAAAPAVEPIQEPFQESAPQQQPEPAAPGPEPTPAPKQRPNARPTPDVPSTSEQSEDLWGSGNIAPPPPVKAAVTRPHRPTETQPLLAPDDVENALRLFDEADDEKSEK